MSGSVFTRRKHTRKSTDGQQKAPGSDPRQETVNILF